VGKLRITCEELPLRAVTLTDREIANVFGGCRGCGSYCITKSDCCSGLACMPFGSTNSICASATIGNIAYRC
jgi:hypothetical protein